MQDFSSLGIELLKYGFVSISFVELYCSSCGGWRCAVGQSYPLMPCPACGLIREAAVIASGFTRHAGQWEKWENPLSAITRHALLVEEGYSRPACAGVRPLRIRWVRYG